MPLITPKPCPFDRSGTPAIWKPLICLPLKNLFEESLIFLFLYCLSVFYRNQFLFTIFCIAFGTEFSRDKGMKMFLYPFFEVICITGDDLISAVSTNSWKFCNFFYQMCFNFRHLISPYLYLLCVYNVFLKHAIKTC